MTKASDHLPLIAEMEMKPVPHPMGSEQLALLIIVLTFLSAIPIGLGITIFKANQSSKSI